jgi:phosphoribosylformylglycinamidine cyclo-ligase
VFGLIQELGAVEKDEMYSTFNMGMGMTAMISAQNAKSVMSMLQAQGECPVIIGEIIKEHTDGRVIFRDHNAG